MTTWTNNVTLESLPTKKNNLTAAAAPTANDDTDDGYFVGSIWIDQTNDRVYIAVDVTAAAAVWEEVGNTGAASFEDDDFFITGSADATKRIRFEVDGLTASTDRTLTVPDADFTFAGINLANGWTAAQNFAAGTTTLPGIYLGGDTGTGFSRPGANIISISNAGTESARFTSAGDLTMFNSNVIRSTSGSATIPAFADAADTDTGIYFPAANQFAITTGGTQRLLVSGSSVQVPGGAEATPSQTYLVDTDTGTYRSAADSWSVTTGGTERFRLDANGNQILGNQAALATTATNGFTYIPSCAGTPTGTPTSVTGKIPLVYDSTNHILYAYSGGAWRSH